ncbi:hypothetical protein MNB_SV-12-802 [hydrothermal vent metagenome]|uniref:ATPase AAA-type core domain-containing protein n=1 Tax=hydrothermal vent metagenome TaxID=652676 RepID=A0A1W1BX11_9ZZZZ
MDNRNKIELTMSLRNSRDDNIDIGFIIDNASGSNYKIYLKNYNTFDYPLFNRFFDNFPNPINIIFSSPIANLKPIEEFKTEPQIKNKIEQRNSIEVLRNRINRLGISYQQFIEKLSYILSNREDNIELYTSSNIQRDIEVHYDISLNARDIAKNLTLLGSGTLQIIEILLSLYESPKDLNLILLDEPDSHIHRDIQKRLMKVLMDFSENIQIFISTHNESLIRSSKPEQIFHLEKGVKKVYKPIIDDEQIYIENGLIPSKHLKVLQDLGNESALDFINALEADKLVLVEGKYDPKYIQYILDKYSDTHRTFHIAYWSFEGIDNILKHIFSYKDMFSKIKNEKSLWEKSILIIDRDYLTENQANKLKTQLERKLGIPVIIWNFYTIESVFLSNIDVFSTIIKEYISETTVTQQQIINDIYNEVKRISEKKLSKFDTEIKGKFLKWISDTQVLFNKNGLSQILPKATAYSDMREFHKAKLEANEIDSLATKDDIEDIIKNVILKYKPTDTTINYFELILKNISKNRLWFDEWNPMISKIKSLSYGV